MTEQKLETPAVEQCPKCACGATKKCRCKWFFLLLLLIVIGGGAGYWMLIGRIHRLDVYQRAMQTIRDDKQVQSQLGLPIHSNHWPPREAFPSARIEDRETDIRWGIHGPKAAAEAHVHARLMAGRWALDIVEVTPAGGKKISLHEADAENDAPLANAPKTGAKKPENTVPPPKMDQNFEIPGGGPPSGGK
jgi:hypothetical protein